MTAGAGGFESLAGAGPRAAGDRGAQRRVPAGIRTISEESGTATTVVLIRHGEAVCNVSGVCGGPIGCAGLTDLGRRQVGALRRRLLATGELAGADALLASVLPRAIETAELLAPALVPVASEPYGAPSAEEASPAIETRCELCELHPGEADGLTWAEYSGRFGAIDWDVDPDRPIAPQGESWTSFVNRVDGALDRVVADRAGQLVVVACHAGVVEASLLAKLPVVGGLQGARLGLRTTHASMTSWSVDAGRWRLQAYNDAAHLIEGAVPG